MNARKILGLTLSWLLLLLPASAPGIAAERDGPPVEESGFLCVGRILDADGSPAVGYRAVFRVPETARVTVTAPADEDGGYAVRLASDASWAPVALITPRGKRLALAAELGIIPATGSRMRYDVRYDEPLPLEVDRPWPELAGNDRLFLSFVEDLPRKRRDRWESSLELADLPGGDRLASHLTAAYQLPALPDVEFGVRLGYAGVDADGPGGEAAGLTDTDLWFRLDLGGPLGTRTRYGVGALLTLPTGDEDEGLGYDAARSKLFVAVRHSLARVELSGHVGVRVNEDGTLPGGATLGGEVAPSLGVAVIVPLRSNRLVVVGEAVYEGERFESAEPAAELLGGVGWRLNDHMAVRGALGLGFDDGAPDRRLLVGLAVDY